MEGFCTVPKNMTGVTHCPSLPYCALLAVMDIVLWAPYHQVGIPVPAGLGGLFTSADISHATKQRGQQLLENLHLRLVKIYRYSRDGEPAGEFSGFLCGTSKAIVTTCRLQWRSTG